MYKTIKTTSDLKKLKNIASDLANDAKKGDLFFLKGELGSGKTTFIRLFINFFLIKNFIEPPKFIKSPTFPIMVSYPLKTFEILHYDLYRLNEKKELLELNIFENISNNITLVEWPEILIKNFKLKNYFLINLRILDDTIREIEIKKIDQN